MGGREESRAPCIGKTPPVRPDTRVLAEKSLSKSLQHDPPRNLQAGAAGQVRVSGGGGAANSEDRLGQLLGVCESTKITACAGDADSDSLRIGKG